MLNETRNLWTGQPVWLADDIPDIETQWLDCNRETDVVIIGAGISGALTAQALAASGQKVILLDRRPLLHGSTSATTALLQYEIDTPMLKLKRQIGLKKATRAWQRSKLALDGLGDKIAHLGIDCDLQRRCTLYLAGNLLNAKQLQAECDLRRSAGLYTEYLGRADLKAQYGIDRDAALLSFGTLAVNPVKLAAGFLKAAQKDGAEIFTPVTASKIITRGKTAIVHTEGGHTITAKTVIHASGYELPRGVSRAKHAIHSTYAIATRPQAKLWPGECLIWEASDPYLYIRSLPDGRVICGGEDQDFADEGERDALLKAKSKKLEKKLAKLLPELDATADYAWCGSFGATATGLPTIGRVNAKANELAILAFGGNGITFSAIAAELLTAQLTGREDIDRHLFSL